MAVNPHNHDYYSAYNKPYAVIDFLTRAPPKEDWLVLLDSDMQLRLPFICGGTEFSHMEVNLLEIDCVRGHPIAAFYGYARMDPHCLAAQNRTFHKAALWVGT